MQENHAQNTALLVIDVQVGLIDGKSPAYRKDEVLSTIQEMLEKARAADAPVIYVQHDGDPGDSLEVDTPGWQIHPQIAPQAGEPIIRKRASDSFYLTTLQQELTARGITHLVIAGCKTEYCIDTTSRRATTLGYHVTLASDAHTTTGNDILTAAQIIAHHNDTLDDFGNDDYAIAVKPGREIVF